jgi:hypothetical protein
MAPETSREEAMSRAALALLLALAATPALAETPVPDSENGRFVFNQTADGLLRLDTRTGQVAVCGKRSDSWVCQIVPDERAALETEIGRLQREVGTLKKELVSRGLPLPSGSRITENKPSDQPNEFVLKLPSDAELDRAMTFFEKMWKRLIEMVQGAQREQEKKS